MHAGAVGKPRIQDGRAHQAAPEQRAPVVRLGLKALFVQDSVITGDQRIVEYGVNLLTSEPAELVEMPPTCAHQRLCPSLASAPPQLNRQAYLRFP